MSEQPTEHEHRVTPIELFFDLVFVFAFTQVTTLMSADPTWSGLGEGVLVLAAVWWAWAGYAWLTNFVDPDQGAVRGAMLVAIIAMFIAALAVPDAFGSEGVLFGVAFLSCGSCISRSSRSQGGVTARCWALCSGSLRPPRSPPG